MVGEVADELLICLKIEIFVLAKDNLGLPQPFLPRRAIVNFPETVVHFGYGFDAFWIFHALETSEVKVEESLPIFNIFWIIYGMSLWRQLI